MLHFCTQHQHFYDIFVHQECQQLGITFHLLIGKAAENIPEFVEDNGIGGVITDFSPLRVPMDWVNEVKNKLPKDIPFCQVGMICYSMQ
jgi:deoxyribodipyrimidine photo-lyase